MRFLVDAQLPHRLAAALIAAGHDARHTRELPDGNATSDEDIMTIADHEDRVVMTKDGDFRNSHLLRGRPHRLLHVRVGNLSNEALLAMVVGHLAEIEEALLRCLHVELTATSLICHVE